MRIPCSRPARIERACVGAAVGGPFACHLRVDFGGLIARIPRFLVEPVTGVVPCVREGQGGTTTDDALHAGPRAANTHATAIANHSAAITGLSVWANHTTLLVNIRTAFKTGKGFIKFSVTDCTDGNCGFRWFDSVGE